MEGLADGNRTAPGEARSELARLVELYQGRDVSGSIPATAPWAATPESSDPAKGQKIQKNNHMQNHNAINANHTKQLMYIWL